MANVVVDEQPKKKCSFCSDEINEDFYFTCKTCESPVSSKGGRNDSESTSEKVLCQMCIIYHSKQKHSIIDSAGCAPLICKKHRNVVLFYCETCQTMFCHQCIETACKHDLTLVDKKRSEVRGNIFDYLGKLDSLDKRVRSRQLLLKDIRDGKVASESDAKHDAEAIYQLVFQDTKDYFIKAVEDIFSKFSIDANKSDYKNIEDMVAEADKLNLALRTILSHSVANQIEEMAELKPKLEASLKNQHTELSQHVSLKRFNIGVAFNPANFKAHLDSVINSIKPAAIEVVKEIPSLVKIDTDMSTKGKLVVYANKFVYLVSGSEGGVLVECWYLHVFLKSQYPQRNPQQQRTLNMEYTDIRAVFAIPNFFGFFLKDGSCQIYRSTDFVQEDMSQKPPHVLCIYAGQNGTLQFVHWDEEKKQICFTHDDSVHINCEKKPVCLKISDSRQMVVFVTETNSIRIFKLDTGSTYVITALEHGLTTVDDLSFLTNSYDKLLAYNNVDNLVAYFTMSVNGTEMKWLLQKVARIDISVGPVYGLRNIINNGNPSQQPNVHSCSVTFCCGLGVTYHCGCGNAAYYGQHLYNPYPCCGLGPNHSGNYRHNCCQLDVMTAVVVANNYVLIENSCVHK